MLTEAANDISERPNLRLIEQSFFETQTFLRINRLRCSLRLKVIPGSQFEGKQEEANLQLLSYRVKCWGNQKENFENFIDATMAVDKH